MFDNGFCFGYIKMTHRKMHEALYELVKELEENVGEVRKRMCYDPHHCSPMYLSGLEGGYIESIKKIKKRFGLRT